MNKLYISLSVAATLALSNTALAQTTITSAASPTVGYTYNMAADTTPADMPTFTVSPTSATAQSWDYSAVFANTYMAPTSFVAPSGNPGATSFPNSNLATDQGGGTWGYLISNSSGLFIDGVNASVSGVTAILDFSPNAPQMPTPFTYSNTTTVTYTAVANTTYSGTPVQIRHLATRTVTADAFGSIITPAGTYSNTLRVHTSEITSDIVFIVFGAPSYFTGRFDTTSNYSWYQNTPNALVMSIDQNTAGATTK